MVLWDSGSMHLKAKAKPLQHFWRATFRIFKAKAETKMGKSSRLCWSLVYNELQLLLLILLRNSDWKESEKQIQADI